MDKNKLMMLSLVAVMFFICGCETAKGFASGIGLTAQGVQKDATNLCDVIKKTDNWMREYMW